MRAALARRAAGDGGGGVEARRGAGLDQGEQLRSLEKELSTLRSGVRPTIRRSQGAGGDGAFVDGEPSRKGRTTWRRGSATYTHQVLSSQSRMFESERHVAGGGGGSAALGGGGGELRGAHVGGRDGGVGGGDVVAPEAVQTAYPSG